MDETRPLNLRYTPTARKEIARTLDYIGTESPKGRETVAIGLRTAIELLQHFPLSGSATTRAGLRHCVVPAAPYIVFYRIERDTVVVVGVRHAARKPQFP